MSETMNRSAGPPGLQQLLTDFLKRVQTTHALEGLHFPGVESEVEPYQPAEVNVLEPRTALEEALASAQWLLADPLDRAQFQPRHLRDLPDWGTLVGRLDPTPFVPMALGYFPQRVREIPSWSREDWLSWRPPVSSLCSTGLWEWGELMLMRRRPAEGLFAAAVLRLLGQTGEARQLLRAVRSQAPAGWRLLLLNEDAALAWQEGEYQTALNILEPAEALPPILLNRGLCLLLLGRDRAAREALAAAAASLPNVSGWHHLAELYRLLVERGL